MAENNDFGMGYAMGQDSNRNNGGMFGGSDGFWGIILLALLFGNGGLNGGFGGGFGGGMMAPWATQADVRAAVDQQTLISKLDQQTYGIADATYSLNNTITNGFHGVDRGLCDISHQISDCCCQTQRAIDSINYNMATGFCDIKNSMHENTRAILDYLTNDKIDGLRAENQALRFQASQVAQNQFITQVGSDIVNRLQPPPVPSYQVPNPYANYSGYGCGCGCGC